MPFIYVYSPSDFVSGLPDEQSAAAAGSPTFTLTLKAGAQPTAVEINDNDSVFDEVDFGQNIAQSVTIDGTTYAAGTTISTAYDLINTTSGHKVTSFHLGGNGYQQGAVDGLASTELLVPGTSYTFNFERTSHQQNNGYADYVACFVSGTHLTTNTGERAVEDLCIGDLVATADHGFQPIRWIASQTVPAKGAFAPVVFPKGTLDNNRDLALSPQHRLCLSGAFADLLFGQTECLAPAIHLARAGIGYQRSGGTVTYWHVMFDAHEIVWAEGTATESFLPGDRMALAPETWEEFQALFPHIAALPGSVPAARPILRQHESAVLLGTQI